MSNWFVIWVMTGKELEVLSKALQVPKIDEAICPVESIYYRKEGAWELRKQVAIPSYVFIRCQMDTEVYHAIRRIPNFIRWLGGDGLWPTIVPEDQMIPVVEMNTGRDPARLLHNVTIDKRKRRGRGTLNLFGTEQTIVFNPRTDKQPDEARVDQSPAADEGEQNQKEVAEGEAVPEA